MEFAFTTEQTCSRADEIIDFLRKPRLWIPKIDYPDYDTWLNKVHTQFKKEDKRAIVALVNNKIVGTIVYQQHKEVSDVLEIKNISVSPIVEGRHVASFLLKNAEIKGANDFHTNFVAVDAKVNNKAINLFLMNRGYAASNPINLYNVKSEQDILYTKWLREPDSNRRPPGYEPSGLPNCPIPR